MCGSVDVWKCGCVEVWMCGSVDVWKCMCKSGNMQMSRYLTHFYLNLVVWKSEVWKSESVEVQKC